MLVVSYPILQPISILLHQVQNNTKEIYFLGESLEGKVVGWANTKSVGLGLGWGWLAEEGMSEWILTSLSDLALLGGVTSATLEGIFEPLVDSPTALYPLPLWFSLSLLLPSLSSGVTGEVAAAAWYGCNGDNILTGRTLGESFFSADGARKVLTSPLCKYKYWDYLVSFHSESSRSFSVSYTLILFIELQGMQPSTAV